MDWTTKLAVLFRSVCSVPVVFGDETPPLRRESNLFSADRGILLTMATAGQSFPDSEKGFVECALELLRASETSSAPV